MHSDKRFVIRLDQRSLSRHAVDRIWPIDHNDFDAMFFAGAHAEIHRPDESVKARANVLKIDEQNIDTLQHFFRWLAIFTVKTVNGNVEPRMLVTFPFNHVVLRLTDEPMLRPEECAKLE